MSTRRHAEIHIKLLRSSSKICHSACLLVFIGLHRTKICAPEDQQVSQYVGINTNEQVNRRLATDQWNAIGSGNRLISLSFVQPAPMRYACARDRWHDSVFESNMHSTRYVDVICKSDGMGSWTVGSPHGGNEARSLEKGGASNECVLERV